MRKYPILLIAWIAPIAVQATLGGETLTDKLKEYCIPKSSTPEACGDLKPRYDGYCNCGNTTYMYYDATERTCRVKCPAGQIPEKTSGGCQAGYGGLKVKDF
jgi:hypothetical protein